MSSVENETMDYLKKTGVLPRLVNILKQVIKVKPQPLDPLMYILHQLNCPLIPQAQMKALERKVTRAHDELRYLRDLLINVGANDDLYDSETDEEEYVGSVEGQICDPKDLEDYGYVCEEDTGDETPDENETEASLFEKTQTLKHYIVQAAVAMTPVDQDAPAGSYEQPCSSSAICNESK
ncbi:uncharacterized protein [Drosophila pseudoobscura]|uniref:c-Myc-binding protein homolog n=1 Tax=Drosophila pseudoobscura pseudoobscura TaxID=46245 RepID=A0A6I8UQZ4_DROPS|nr:uncharacterized protein LOC4802652 [Drosophila pseudoobscura]